MADICVCDNLCVGEDGRLCTCRNIVELGMTDAETLPADTDGGSTLQVSWNVVNTLEEEGGPHYQVDLAAGCITIQKDGIYFIDSNRRDSPSDLNVGKAIGYAILINGVRTGGTIVTRGGLIENPAGSGIFQSFAQSHRLQATKLTTLNAGDVVCAEWSVVDAVRPNIDAYPLLGDTRNSLSIVRVG